MVKGLYPQLSLLKRLWSTPEISSAFLINFKVSISLRYSLKQMDGGEEIWKDDCGATLVSIFLSILRNNWISYLRNGTVDYMTRMAARFDQSIVIFSYNLDAVRRGYRWATRMSTQRRKMPPKVPWIILAHTSGGAWINDMRNLDAFVFLHFRIPISW